MLLNISFKTLKDRYGEHIMIEDLINKLSRNFDFNICVPETLHDVDWDNPAVIQVRSLDHFEDSHCIYYDGHQTHDFNFGRRYQSLPGKDDILQVIQPTDLNL